MIFIISSSFSLETMSPLKVLKTTGSFLQSSLFLNKSDGIIPFSIAAKSKSSCHSGCLGSIFKAFANLLRVFSDLGGGITPLDYIVG